MHEADNPDELAEQLHQSFPQTLTGIIAIDGYDGVGKTTLATALQARVGGTVVSLDDLIMKNQGGYVPYLKTAELKAALKTAPRPCIVEGVCVLGVFERITVRHDLLVYVKRVDKNGYWYDKDTCDPSGPVDELIARRAEEVTALDRLDQELSGEPSSQDDRPGLTPLREEIIRYHASYRPSRQAEIVFLRREDG